MLTQQTGYDSRPLSKAEIHDVLSNDRRRRVLELLDGESPRDLRSLADAIAAAETGDAAPPRKVRQSVYVTLHQSHLPKLARLGVVDYDSTSKRVALGERAPEVRVYMEVVAGGEMSWAEYHAALAVVGLAATVASLFGAWPIAVLPPVAYAVGALGLLCCSLLVETRRRGTAFTDWLRAR